MGYFGSILSQTVGGDRDSGNSHGNEVVGFAAPRKTETRGCRPCGPPYGISRSPVTPTRHQRPYLFQEV